MEFRRKLKDYQGEKEKGGTQEELNEKNQHINF
jgi:hypothetical protein